MLFLVPYRPRPNPRPRQLDREAEGGDHGAARDTSGRYQVRCQKISWIPRILRGYVSKLDQFLLCISICKILISIHLILKFSCLNIILIVWIHISQKLIVFWQNFLWFIFLVFFQDLPWWLWSPTRGSPSRRSWGCSAPTGRLSSKLSGWTRGLNMFPQKNKNKCFDEILGFSELTVTYTHTKDKRTLHLLR